MLNRLQRTRWIQQHRHKSVLHSSGTDAYMYAVQNTLHDVYFIQSDRVIKLPNARFFFTVFTF